ncbi:Phytochrome-like protein cph2 [compost metagenome]
MLLPNTSRQRATAIGEGIRRAVAEQAILHEDNEGGIVTVSIGVATAIPQDDESAAGLVEAADAAVYQAKEAGRNRVAAAPA